MRMSLLGGALAGVCLLWNAGAAQAQEQIAWAKSLPAALTQAKAAKKLVMADFFTEW